MAVQTYQSRPAAGQLMLEGLAGGLGSAAGQQLGRGLGSLVGLGAEKIGLTGPSQQEIDLLKNMGMSDEQAKGFHRLDPRAQQQVLANLAERQKIAKSSAAYGALEGGKQSPDQQLMQQMQQAGVTEQEMQDLMKASKLEEEKPEYKVKPEFHESPHDVYKNLTIAGLNPKEAKDFADLYKTEYKGQQTKADAYVKEVKKDAKGAKENNQRLSRMYELVQKGDLTPSATGTVLSALEKGIDGLVSVGIDLHGLTSTDSQEFKKLSMDFIKTAKDYFPGRVTDNDVKLLLQTVPTLSQSDDAKLRLINTLTIMNDAALLTDKTIKQIKAENNGKIPVNIEDMVEDRIGKQLDILANKMKKGESVLPGYKKATKAAGQKSSAESLGALGGATAGALGGFAAGGIPGAALGALGGLWGGSQAPGLIGAGQGESLSEYGIEPGLAGLFGKGPIA